jgi:hypothetical protein
MESDNLYTEWWREVIAPYAHRIHGVYEEFRRLIDQMAEEERLHLDDALSRVDPHGRTFEVLASKLLDMALITTEGQGREEWFLRRMEQRDKRLGVRGKRHLVVKLPGKPNPRPSLGEQTKRASALLLGKTVKAMTRARRGELAVEFTDGSQLSVGATPMGLDLEIKTDVETWAEGGDDARTSVM